MIILLPLTLLGVGFFVTYLFKAASHALALAIAASAMLASAHAGASPIAVILIGLAAFMASTGFARFAALAAPLPARFAMVAAVTIAAMIAGFQVGHGLAGLAGLPANVLAIAAAILTGLAAATRLTRPAH